MPEVRLRYRVHSVSSSEMSDIATVRGVETRVKVPVREIELVHVPDENSPPMPQGTITLRLVGEEAHESALFMQADYEVDLVIEGSEISLEDPDPEPEAEVEAEVEAEAETPEKAAV